jgi:hypothetical protein
VAVVYLHRKEHDNSIYYVGIGNNEGRAREIRGRSEHWTRVFNKYGRNIDVVANNISLEDAKELEMFLISEIGLNNLCNHTLGGEGFFGGKHTQEAKEKISKAKKGKIPTQETKDKMSEAKKGKCCRGHKVLDTKTGVEYRSMLDYCKRHGLSDVTVSRNINGKTKINKYKNIKYI